MPPRAVVLETQCETACAARTLRQLTPQRAASAQCSWSGVSPLYHLASCVCWSLRRLCERVQNHGPRRLLCLSTSTPLPGGLCVRACSNHRPQQHPHQTTIAPAVAFFVHPTPGACLQLRAHPVLSVGRTSFPSNFARKW